MSDMPVFASPLGGLLEQYIAHRRMRGYKSAGGEEDIRQFDVYAAALPITTDRLTKELVEVYIARRPGEKPSTQCHRVSTVRCFGKYLVRCGMDAYVLPNGVLTVGKYGFVPYVLSTKEVTRLMGAADLLPYRACSPQRHIVMPMMLRLIYSCGLRISEAIKLRVEDVDLQTGVLLVRAAKFNKDRYVPMAPSLLQRCQNYAARLAVGGNAKSPFLPSPARGLYSKSTIGHAFRQCLVIAGIPHTDDGPTVHSLRHSFAVHNLVRWGMEGKDVNALLPYLSAYMGHENLLGTERYLRMTVEMFPEMRDRISAGCSWIMPEVGCHEG
ncbi:MAG: tyrosine-type recombinase/integrase [Syntrophomonas sp.]